ncbi:hypothetical protein WJX72_007092 [[Myrmecia] bisecta]|uniref:Kelch repeat-containing protein n=1 Tax=[Myrmecia] bisecta TaxID=41462 RepID=A0AAW1PQR2_9CHLO
MSSVITRSLTGKGDLPTHDAIVCYQEACLSLSPSALNITPAWRVGDWHGTDHHSPDCKLFRREAALPSPRSDFQAVAADDKAWMVGGHDGNGTYLTSIFVYDSILNAGNSSLPKMPEPRTGFAATYLNVSIYVIGGVKSQANEQSGTPEKCTLRAPRAVLRWSTARTLDSVEVLYASEHPEVFVHTRDPAATAVSAAPRRRAAAGRQPARDSFNYMGSLYAGSGYWSSGPELPFPWSDQDVVTEGDVAYIVGGRNVSANQPTDQLYKYEPVLRQFTQLATMPETRTSASAAIVGGLLYVTGGYNNVDDPQVGPAATSLIYLAGGYSTNYTQTLSTAEVYDPNTDSWSPLTDMPTPRGDLLCEALNGEVVMVGGFYDPTGQFLVNSFRTEVEAYKPSRRTWRELAAVPNARGDFALVAMPGGRMLAMGGETHARGDRTQIATH